MIFHKYFMLGYIIILLTFTAYIAFTIISYMPVGIPDSSIIIEPLFSMLGLLSVVSVLLWGRLRYKKNAEIAERIAYEIIYPQLIGLLIWGIVIFVTIKWIDRSLPSRILLYYVAMHSLGPVGAITVWHTYNYLQPEFRDD